MTILSIARPNNESAIAVLTISQVIYQGPKSKYNVIPKASIAIINCRYSLRRLQGIMTNQTIQKNTKRAVIWNNQSLKFELSQLGDKYKTIKKAQTNFFSMSNRRILLYLLICLALFGKSRRSNVGKQSQSAENRNRKLQQQYFYYGISKLIRQKLQIMTVAVMRAKNIANPKHMIPKVELKSGFNIGTAIIKAISWRVKQNAYEKQLPTFLLIYFCSVISRQSRATFKAPKISKTKAKKPQVEATLIVLLIIPYQTVQIGVVGSLLMSAQPSLQLAQDLMPKYNQT